MSSASHGGDDEMKDEYDFSQARVEQGRFYEFALRAKARRRTLPEDLAQKFPDDASVIEALREHLRLKRESA